MTITLRDDWTETTKFSYNWLPLAHSGQDACTGNALLAPRGQRGGDHAHLERQRNSGGSLCDRRRLCRRLYLGSHRLGISRAPAFWAWFWIDHGCRGYVFSRAPG